MSFSQLSLSRRLLFVASTVWIIFVFSESYRSLGPTRWDDILQIGVLPVIVAWGLIWIFDARKKKS